MTTFDELVERLQPKRGKRGFAATIDEGRVAAALMLAQNESLAAATVCDRCKVPSFRSRVKGLANTIKQLGMQGVALPEAWTTSELADVPQPTSHGKANHTPVSQHAEAPQSTAKKMLLPSSVEDSSAQLAALAVQDAEPLPTVTSVEKLTPGRTRIKRTFTATSPGGTRTAEASSYKLVTPEGERAGDVRDQRKHAERSAAYRARGKAVALLDEPESVDPPPKPGRETENPPDWEALEVKERELAEANRKAGYRKYLAEQRRREEAKRAAEW